jgi:PAS domain S-box-containing protein
MDTGDEWRAAAGEVAFPEQAGEAPRWDDPYVLLYKELFEYAAEAQLVTDASGIIREANGATARLLHCPREFLPGKPLGIFMAAPSRSRFYQLLVGLARHTPAGTLEAQVVWPGRPPRDVIVFGSQLMAAPGERTPAIGWVLRDVTGELVAEAELRMERQLLDGVLEEAQVFVLITDRQGEVRRANAYAYTASGYGPDDLVGRPWYQLLVAEADRPDARRMTTAAAVRGSARSGVLRLEGKGAERAVAWKARGLLQAEGVSSVVLLGRDVTELQEAQGHALHAERLAAIGQTAAGLAHESRNALQRGHACLELLRLRILDRPEALDLLNRVQQAQDDLLHLYENVRAFASPVRRADVACDPAEIWRAAWAELCWRPGWEGAQLHEVIEEPGLRCVADPFQLKQVLVNLFENSFAATASPLQMLVRCSPGRLRGQDAVRLSLQDNGPGFPADAREKLFEPFFTTKTRGTGLGLAICKRIVEAHGGRIEAADGPGAEILITLARSTP